MSDIDPVTAQRLEAATMRNNFPIGEKRITASGRVVTIREHGGNYFVATFDDRDGQSWEMWDAEGKHASDGSLTLFPYAEPGKPIPWHIRHGLKLAAAAFVAAGMALAFALMLLSGRL